MPIKKVIATGRVPVKIYTNDLAENTLRQLENVSQLPFVHHHVAAMPDVHYGLGATIGSVIPTRGAIIPAAVGVDIGCGVVTRKGAIRARAGDLGIIPGSMGARSYIVRGKGNPDSLCSCAHGAGRRMSRTEAKKRFTVDDLKAQTSGVECRKDQGVLDEIPGAYKDIDVVMENQQDLVEVLHTLKQLLTVKG